MMDGSSESGVGVRSHESARALPTPDSNSGLSTTIPRPDLASRPYQFIQYEPLIRKTFPGWASNSVR